MSYGYAGSSFNTAAASGSALKTTSQYGPQAPVTRSRTGLFLSYRDTVIRSSSTSKSHTRHDIKGKGKAREYEYPGDDGDEQEGLLADDGGRSMNGRHEVVQMNQLPPQW
jgi:hypothetical protein